MNTTSPPPPLLERMSALADPVRVRMLRVLESHELSVSELCAIVQLPQSTVSRHLKVLGDDGWVVARSEGTSRRYRMMASRLDAAGRRLWGLVREQAEGIAATQQDAERVRSVLAERRSRSRAFFSSAAGEWDRMRGELFGRRVDLMALLGLLDERWVVGDLGCGTGQVAESLARFVGRVVAVDESAEMLEAARGRLEGVAGVEIRRGALESLPIEDGELDAAVLFLVLPYLVEPARALAEAGRVLRGGGRLLVVDLTSHDREEYLQRMGHLWQGFGPEELGAWVEEAGFSSFRYVRLPADPEAKGPVLFAASARKESNGRSSITIPPRSRQ